MTAEMKVRVKKNLRALFVLGLALTLLATVGGAVILTLGYSRAPNAAQPVWKFGQWIMLFGLANLFVYVCIFLQIRGLMRLSDRSEQ